MTCCILNIYITTYSTATATTSTTNVHV